ncbi:hypothetical protein GFK26_14735 [Variovorax paradoxus]|uniref:Uncharacterized protein n=1 Tax=Variovorax paradoxus TaxID=34073 RepID=A0A5Q0M316_VARPD|nr:hypothetical protein [Variovorax paradoxus]QFZ83923.1 hypothetical protein GFK26_14735 [Variovorax paradoxus]
MADRIIAGRNAPASHDVVRQPDASDILENKLTQLQSLLSCCYGDEGEWFEAIGARRRDNIMWIAADLAGDAMELSQLLLKKSDVNTTDKT